MTGECAISMQRRRGKDNLKGSISNGKEAGRTRRVTRIKDKFESGKYRVEPKKVADKMVEDAVRDIRSRGH